MASDPVALERELHAMRREIAAASSRAGEGHVPSALSILDLLWVEYREVIAAQEAAGQAPDTFILSKGHASLGLYALLVSIGTIPSAWLDQFGTYDSHLGGHPDSNQVPGVVASTGSLGHGLPIGVGMALAKRITGQDGRIVVLIGDGEANEGTVWESALLAGHHALENLVCIVDHNHSTDRALMVDSLAAKFAAFGWNAVEIDGHDHPSILQALTLAPTGAPTVVIAETIKGRGIAQMENNPAWHHASPTAADLVEMFGDQS